MKISNNFNEEPRQTKNTWAKLIPTMNEKCFKIMNGNKSLSHGLKEYEKMKNKNECAALYVKKGIKE